MINRRIDTKQIFAKSFIELLKFNSFNKITIQKIADNCGFKRQTFYLHFKDKYDLMNWIYKQKNDTIMLSYLNTISWEDILYNLLSYHKSNKKFYSEIMSYSGQNSVREYISKYTYDTYFTIIKKNCSKILKQDNFNFTLKLYSYGSAQMTLNWIDHGMKESPEHIAAGLYNSMNPEIKKYFLKIDYGISTY